MLQAFRNFFKSKLGIAVTLAFLGLIALAFASMDVANTGTFGGVSGGDRVAIAGDRKITTSELSTAASRGFDSARQENPTLSLQSFLTAERMDQVMDQLLQRFGVAEFGRTIGLRAGGRLVDSEIVQIPAFRGADGNFSQDAFDAVIAQQGLSEKAVRDDIATGLFARQTVIPVTYQTIMPDKIVRRYASLLRESRQGAVAVVPSTAYAPEADPDQEQLQAFYQAHRDNYMRPERRVIRYGTFGIDAVGDLAAPTQAQIMARYDADSALYSASESRTVTQLVAPTEAAAQAIVAEVAGGKSLEASAREKGLSTTRVGPAEQAELASSTSAAVARSVFAAASGTLATPARGGLGWYVMRVDEITRREGRSLEQVRGEISEILAAEQRRAALDDLSAEIEDQLDSGESLTEVTQSLGIELQETKPVTGDGRIYLSPAETLPGELVTAVSTAFAMEEEEPQIAVLEAGTTFLLFEVSDITPAAAAPLAEIADRVKADWKLGEGNRLAREAADRILSRLGEGTTLAAAVAEEEATLPRVDTIDMNRQQLQQMGGRVPPVLALVFSMAQGTAKKLEAPRNAGWFVADLDTITPGEVDANDPMLLSAKGELGPLAGDELAQQFTRAALVEIGSELNPAAISAVRDQLTGRSQ